ncbi:MAG: hypothetical protein ABIH26_02450 [Candidatus Eisenbacteria bacterium]
MTPRLPPLLLARVLLGSLASAALLAAPAPLFARGPAAEPLAASRPGDLRSRIESFEDRIMVLAPDALHRLQPESETWILTTPEEGLPGAPLHALALAGGAVWVTGDGAAFSDARFDDWRRYAAGEGYPGRTVYDVESDEDYAYAGTDEGAARFDLYVLEWETLRGASGEPLGPVLDVAVGDETVWFALDRGVAEYRKETESVRVDTELGGLRSPRAIALRQSARFLWAITDGGVARYDKDLQTWTSFQAGAELPDARVRQVLLQGEDLWLGTDAGLWHYAADSGIWRLDESMSEMPGNRILAFALEPDRIWVATESAFAVYEKEAARWLDFTASVPLAPEETTRMFWDGATLVLLGRDAIVYGLSEGRAAPGLFTYRVRPFARPGGASEPERGRRRLGLDESGLGLRLSPETSLALKGGTTVFVENEAGKTGFGNLVTDTRTDLVLNGRLGRERSLTGFYDTTDPENAAYQVLYRGGRDDILRSAAAGEIDPQIFNSNLSPGAGVRGGEVRVEYGGRTEIARRRLLTAEAWAGKRRTLPGRDVFSGGNLSVERSLRDIDFARRAVFAVPEDWPDDDIRSMKLFVDDADPSTDDANTDRLVLAGNDGSWDLLRPNEEYVLGPRGRTIILEAPLGESGRLVAVRSPENGPPTGAEADLTEAWARNHYGIAVGPNPGSLVVAIVDSTGERADASGTDYLRVFGLDADADGLADPEAFSPITGYLRFPDSLPFPPETYEEAAVSRYAIACSYQTSQSILRLAHRDVVPGSERILVDRTLLEPDVDYSFLAKSGLFILFEHILLDDDTVIEVDYEYEAGGETDEGNIVGGQLGLAPDDRLFLGANASRWTDREGKAAVNANLNARLEWKDESRFLRLAPELSWSEAEGSTDSAHEARDGAEERRDIASGVELRGRYREVEVSASHRNLGSDFASFENRRTLVGRLREESKAWGRWNLTRELQAEVEWEKTLADRAAAEDGAGPDPSDSASAGFGEVSSLTGSIRLSRSGLPNLKLRRGRVLQGGEGLRSEKWVTRAELEISPDQAGLTPFGMERVWLRTFFQRSDRERDEESADDRTASRAGSVTDHLFARFNGSAGFPLSWNLAFEDRRTRAKEERRDIRLRQKADATLYSQPHASVDAFLRYEASRDLFWRPSGSSEGYGIERFLLATIQLYPGRIARMFSPLSFRVDLGNDDDEQGEPGSSAPGARGLWRETAGSAERRRSRSEAYEMRVQLVSWLRLVERWETESDRTTREGLSTEGTERRIESRFEIRPSRGLVTVRLIGDDADRGTERTDRRRFSGLWEQVWGGGFLTYLSLEAQRTENRDRRLGDRIDTWNPLGQITLRRALWRLDATLGGSLSWTRSEDLSGGASADRAESRRQTVSVSVSAHPHRVLTVKLDYSLGRSEADVDARPEARSDGWSTEHDFRIRVQLRA